MFQRKDNENTNECASNQIKRSFEKNNLIF